MGMSTIATVREIVEQERAQNIDDHVTAGLLRASKLKPPPGYCWSVPAIREGVSAPRRAPGRGRLGDAGTFDDSWEGEPGQERPIHKECLNQRTNAARPSTQESAP